MIDNLTYEEAMEMIQKFEGLEANAYGAKEQETHYTWQNEGYFIFFENGECKYRFKDNIYNEDKRNIFGAYPEGWKIYNANLVPKTRLADKLYPDAMEYGGKLVIWKK